MGGAGEKAKAKTQKMKQPPASSPASPELRQVGKASCLGSLHILLSVPPSAPLGPVPSKVHPSFSHSVIPFWVLGMQPRRRPDSCHHGPHSVREKTESEVRAQGGPHGKAQCWWREPRRVLRERRQAGSPQGSAGGAEICKREGQAVQFSGDTPQATMAGAKALWQTCTGNSRNQ